MSVTFAETEERVFLGSVFSLRRARLFLLSEYLLIPRVFKSPTVELFVTSSSSGFLILTGPSEVPRYGRGILISVFLVIFELQPFLRLLLALAPASIFGRIDGEGLPILRGKLIVPFLLETPAFVSLRNFILPVHVSQRSGDVVGRFQIQRGRIGVKIGVLVAEPERCLLITLADYPVEVVLFGILLVTPSLKILLLFLIFGFLAVQALRSLSLNLAKLLFRFESLLEQLVFSSGQLDLFEIFELVAAQISSLGRREAIGLVEIVFLGSILVLVCVLFGSEVARFQIIIVVIRLIEVKLHGGLIRSASVHETILVDVAHERSPCIIS